MSGLSFSSKELWLWDEVFPDSAFPLAIIRSSPQIPHTWHRHEGFSELVIISEGKGLHFTGDDEVYEVNRGDAFVISGDQGHGYRDVHDLELVNVVFDSCQMLERMAHVRELPGYHTLFNIEPRFRKDHGFESWLHVPPGELSRILDLIDLIEEELAHKREGYRFAAMGFLMEAVTHVCRNYSGYSGGKYRDMHSLAATIGHLEANYAEPVNIEDLVRIAQMPERTFMRAFKTVTGFSPIEYLLRVRIARASELLRHSTRTITQIAFEVGFMDSNYFTSQFKRIRKTTPREFRCRNRDW